MAEAISLFSGAGGMDIGLGAAGFQVVRAVEMDPHACATLRANHPGLQVLECRVEAVDDWGRYVGIDLVAGGPPCQPFSGAGRGRGQYDDRDGFPAFIRAVSLIQPRAFIAENVRGLTFAKHQRYLQQVLGDLRSWGYRVEARRLNAADLGVPQFRDRVFIVGLRVDEPGRFRWPAPTHLGPHRRHGTLPLFGEPHITVRDALGLQGQLRDMDMGHHPTTEPAPTLSTSSDNVMAAVRRHDNPLNLDEPGRGVRSGGNGHAAPPVMLAMHGKPQSQRLLAADLPAPAMQAMGQGSTGTRAPRLAGDDHVAADGTHYRRLTETESAALQAFPPDYIFCGTRTAVYRQVGNACPPPLAEAVGRAMAEALGVRPRP